MYMNDIASLKNTILELASPLVDAMGLEIWGLELKGAPRFLVRLYVELPLGQRQPAPANSCDEPQDSFSTLYSPTIDQCEALSRQLGLALDVRDCISGPWVLEVSTPGLERIFFRLEQMRSHVGDMVEVVKDIAAPDGPFAGRRVFRGRLLEVLEDYFVIQPCSISAEGEVLPDNLPEAHIDWNNVHKARRLEIFTPPAKPGKSGRGKKAR